MRKVASHGPAFAVSFQRTQRATGVIASVIDALTTVGVEDAARTVAVAICWKSESSFAGAVSSVSEGVTPLAVTSRQSTQ